MSSPDPVAFLEQTVESTRSRFEARATLLGFAEYLDRVAAEPAAHLRDAARYVRDAVAWFGTERVDRPYGRFTRHRIFDAAFDDGRDPVIGQEVVQEAVIGLLTDFARAGRVNRLVLLNGPNGSAKSSFVACLMRGLEHYSDQPEGALYTFNWVFPSAKFGKGGIGFGSGRAVDELETFAHLKEGDVDARIRCETRDHPLLLLPRDARRAFMRSIVGDAPLPQSLTEGELSPKARQIYDALLKAYQGNLGEVLKHVQVERFYISRRYREAAVTVDPQMRVDAGVRQLTADRSLGSLPPSLHNLTLFEPVGDLVDANRGVVEYNDLLKRNIEAFKYLLSTCETGAVRLDTMVLHLDAVLLGTCNAGRLTAFKGSPDFASFKARIELVTMPYLVDYRLERHIYSGVLDELGRDLAVGPHVAEALALWAVMCRLERPLLEGVERPEGINKVLAGMSPLDKARLYAEGRVPDGVPRDVANSLTALIPELYRERARDEGYEGRRGPSPRALKGLLLSAARSAKTCLTTVGLLDALTGLVQETAVYPWLAIEPDGPWHHPRKAIDLVRAWYLDRVEDELHQAMGLVDETATADLVRRYIDHAVHFVRGEKRINPVTGRAEDPDIRLMQDVERRLRVELGDAPGFREGVVHRIAAWRMEHPDDALDFGAIFKSHIDRLNESFYDEKRRQSARIRRDLLAYLVEDGVRLEAEAHARVQRTVAALEADFGYDRACAVEVIGFLFRQRADATDDA